MNQKLLRRITRAFDLPNIEWVESADIIRGFKIKAEVITHAVLKIADELGYKLRFVKPYELDHDYIIALFEPKEIKE